MSKRESVIRYNLIINKLRKRPQSFDQLLDYLKEESSIQGYNFIISKRTFQRDIQDIFAIYNIEIKFDHRKAVYYIGSDENQMVTGRILEAFDIINFLNISDKIAQFIHFDKKSSQGTEHLFSILHSIKQKLVVRFTYHKFFDYQFSKRIIEPYALKEFKNRWYVLAKDIKDDEIKSFSLDRIDDLEITKKNYQIPDNFSVEAYYEHCFGIIMPNSDLPEDVVLDFDAFLSNYIKSLPLHHSQELLSEGIEGMRIKLKLFLTDDFIMELLSFGDHVKVIYPEALKAVLIETYKSSLERYNK